MRAALLAFQRDFAANPPDGAPGAVLDGRDIGTVVCPGADAKIFIDGQAMGSSPLKVSSLDKGRQLRVRASKAGYEDVTEDVRIVTDDLHPEVTLELPRKTQ